MKNPKMGWYLYASMSNMLSKQGTGPGDRGWGQGWEPKCVSNIWHARLSNKKIRNQERYEFDQQSESELGVFGIGNFGRVMSGGEPTSLQSPVKITNVGSGRRRLIF